MAYYLFEHPVPEDESQTKIVNLTSLFVNEGDSFPAVVNPRVFEYVFTNGKYATRFGGNLPPKVKMSGMYYPGREVKTGDGTTIDQSLEFGKLINFAGRRVTLRIGDTEDTATQEGYYKVTSVKPSSSYSIQGDFLRTAWSMEMTKEYESLTNGSIRLARAPSGNLIELTGNSTVITFTSSVLTGNGDLPYPLEISAIGSQGIRLSVSQVALYDATDSFTVTVNSPYPAQGSISVFLHKGSLGKIDNTLHNFDVYHTVPGGIDA